MSLKAFFADFTLLGQSSKGGILRLRELILQLAIQGKIVTQEVRDEPASGLLERARHEKNLLITEGKLKPQKEVNAANIDFPFPLPTRWTWTCFDEIRTYAFTGLERSQREQSGSNEYAYLKMNNITLDGRCDLTFLARVNATDQERNKFSLSGGDFLFNTRNSYSLVGKTCVFPDNIREEVLFNNNILKVKFAAAIDPHFINLWFVSSRGRAILDTLKSSTTNVAAIYQGKLSRFPIPLPPLEEQKRIVAKVDKLMRLCDELEERQYVKHENRARLNTAALAPLNRAASLAPSELEQAVVRLADNFDTLYDSIDTVARLRTTILQLAVQGKLVSQDVNNEPAGRILEKIQDCKAKTNNARKRKNAESENETIPFEVPPGWVWSPLADLGVTQTGTTPSTSRADFYGRDYAFIKPADITSSKINYRVDGLTKLGLEAGRLVPANSVLMVSIGGSIGKVGLVLRDCSCNQQVNYITLHNEIMPELVYYYMKSPYFQQQVRSRAPQTTLPILSKGKWELIPLPLPPLPEQKRIVAKVNQLLSLCDELEMKIRQAEAHSEKLMNAAVQHVLQCITHVEMEIATEKSLHI